MTRVLSLTILLAFAGSAIVGQQPQSPDIRKPSPPEEIVRISVNLVQVDATVADKKGQEITDLSADDFTVLANGKPQTITHFSYVPAATPESNASATKTSASPSTITRNQVRRTIALVVDDLGLSAVSIQDVKKALSRFVADQMRSGDLVAILRTGEGVGLLQQFTVNRDLLNAAIERLRWNPVGRAGAAAALSQAGKRFEEKNKDHPLLDADLEQQRKIYFALGTVSSLQFIVRALGALPGRKSVVLFSDGLPLFTMKEEDDLSPSTRVWNVLDRRVRDAALDLAKTANRAATVIHTIEARGPQTMGGRIEDMDAPLNSQQFYADQDGLGFLADETGGIFAQSSDLSLAMARVFEQDRGYYLIGFKPDGEWFKPEAESKPPKVELKTNRPNLNLRYRKGFYGSPEDSPSRLQDSPRGKLFAALRSPFGASDINLKLTTLFAYDKRDGAFVRTLLFIGTSGLTFTEQPQGKFSANANLLAEVFAQDGRMIQDINKTITINARKEELESIKRGGFVYELTVPVKDPGAYQFRFAVQDAGSERLGAASNFVEVPNVSEGRLALSDIIVFGKTPTGKDSKQFQSVDSQAATAERKFKRGTELSYALIVYNPTLDPVTHRPRLETQLSLYFAGKPIYAGAPKTVQIGSPENFKQVLDAGTIDLGTALTPGDYALKIMITDVLAKGKHKNEERWIGFDVVD
jgi:VWFA-related protein